MTVLAFAMVNNGVHWFSDYPLAIALGYTFAKVAVNRGRTQVNTTTANKEQSFFKSISIAPTTIYQYPGVALRYFIK
jgi:hypothetical protein